MSGRLARLFEGWQLGVISLGIAALGMPLLVPHDVTPDILPLPRVDRSTERLERRQDRALAEVAYKHRLSHETRAVGERFRRYGKAASTHDEVAAHAELLELGRAVLAARQRGGFEELRVLRAIQGELFTRALTDWEANLRVSDDLVELGGDLLDQARANRWMVAPHRWVATAEERATLFKVRWARLTGLWREPALAPTLNDWRVYFRFLLQHPDLGRKDNCSPASLALVQLAYVEALAKHDPEYPILLARGVLEYRLGYRAKAVSDFQAFLEANSQGPWRLRARGYLAAARTRLNESFGP